MWNEFFLITSHISGHEEGTRFTRYTARHAWLFSFHTRRGPSRSTMERDTARGSTTLKTLYGHEFLLVLREKEDRSGFCQTRCTSWRIPIQTRTNTETNFRNRSRKHMHTNTWTIVQDSKLDIMTHGSFSSSLFFLLLPACIHYFVHCLNYQRSHYPAYHTSPYLPQFDLISSFSFV